MKALQAGVLETFAEAAAPPSGRRQHFDASLEVENAVRAPRDWGPYVTARLDKSGGPNACWLWSGAPRVALRMKRRKVGGVWTKKILEQAEFRRLIWLVVHGELPKGRLYMTCKEEWCGNHGHFIEKMPGVKKSRVGSSFGKSQPIAERRITGKAASPVHLVPELAPEVTDEDALIACIAALRPLTTETRTRVLAAAVAFLG